MTIIKFITKNSSHSISRIGYKNRYIEEMVNTKFLGLQIDKHLNWKNHIEQLVPKLSAACYAMTSVVYIGNINTLQAIYYAHFHSVVKCGIILWGNFKQRKDVHFTKENRQNYGWCTTQNLMQKSI
jgi:hypothetical protein